MKMQHYFRMSYFCLPLTIITVNLSPAQSLQYRDVYYDPALKEMREDSETKAEEAKALTEKILEGHEQDKKAKRDSRKIMTVDLSEVDRPISPAEFDRVFHFPPHRQYRTGTCWSFSTTSFLESELYRIRQEKIKLSEIHTVYYEYLAKARRFVKERGESNFGQGSESNAVTRMWQRHGIVPLEDYPGVLREDNRFDHADMYKELKAYLHWIKEENLWDTTLVDQTLRVIMNRYLGEPPTKIRAGLRTYTPEEYAENVVQLIMDDYVCLMSTLRYPFYTWNEYDVPDNWWHSQAYYNVPVDKFYTVIKSSIQNGYSVFIGGDVSEPGMHGFENTAIIPPFDIPADLINQEAREYRIYNGSTTDDHGIHIVGYTRRGDDDWFLIKDSGSRAYRGNHDGYFFYRGDYIKLKMRTLMVHKDRVQAVIPEFNG